MDKYFFVLGRYPSISLSEIQAVLQKNNLNNSQIFVSPEIAVFELGKEKNLSEIIKLLGGTVKIGKILGEALLSGNETNFSLYFEAGFLKENLIPPKTKKLHFGISIYDGGGDKKIIKKLENNLADFQVLIKNNLKTIGLKSGFLRIKDRNISSVAVEKNHLLDKGFELVLIATKEKIMIGKTVAVQDFSSFAARDMERPRKDKRSGILPIKLARMMVNMAVTSDTQTILDPFCGSGTILLEGALMGIKNLLGADIDQKAIAYTKQNLEWLFEKYNLDGRKYKIKLLRTDIHILDKSLKINSIDAIVTEPYLGPPQFRPPMASEAERIISDLTLLYKRSLSVLSNLLKINGKLVIIFPFIQTQFKNYYIDGKIIEHGKFKMKQEPLMYSSPGQFVGRQIYCLEKI